MLTNLIDILTTEEKISTIKAVLAKDSYSLMGDEYCLTEDTAIELVLKNKGKNKCELSGKGSFSFEGVCSRCLKPTKFVVEVDIFREYIFDGVNAIDDSEVVIEEGKLDIDALLLDEISINWPMKVLCSTDCKGICMKCGKDLNEGSCDCDTFVPDPRMAAIGDIFRANKEV